MELLGAGLFSRLRDGLSALLLALSSVSHFAKPAIQIAVAKVQHVVVGLIASV